MLFWHAGHDTEARRVTGKFQALVGCQNDDCAAEVSHDLSMVRLFRDKPICQACHEWDIDYDDDTIDARPSWDELPEISLEDLCA